MPRELNLSYALDTAPVTLLQCAGQQCRGASADYWREFVNFRALIGLAAYSTSH